MFLLGCSVRLNGVEKLDVDKPKTPESQRFPTLSIQELSETQLYTVRGLETAKALGFSRFFVSRPIYGES